MNRNKPAKQAPVKPAKGTHTLTVGEAKSLQNSILHPAVKAPFVQPQPQPKAQPGKAAVRTTTLFRNPTKVPRMTHISEKCRQRRLRALKFKVRTEPNYAGALKNLATATGLLQPTLYAHEGFADLANAVAVARASVEATWLAVTKAQEAGDVSLTKTACTALLDAAVMAETVMWRVRAWDDAIAIAAINAPA